MTAYRKSYFLLFLALLATSLASAQNGPHAADINWQQINTSKFRLIFPEGYEQQGLRVANLIDYMDKNATRSIGELSEKINIVLHNQTIVPNGFVGIAPFRSEFFATPPQSPNFLGTVDWIDALAIHEYRHVQQYANAKVGLSKLMYILQGDNGWGLASSASIPGWFWEGDATIMETALTKGGRGRAPFFTLQQRATLLNGRKYNYQKARNRSFKDLVPNHYRLGYAMVMYGKEHYGNDFWQPIFADAASYKPLFYSFSNSLKRKTGLKTKDLYQKTYRDLRKTYKAQVDNLTFSPTDKINAKPKKTVTNYRFPFPLKRGGLVCLKSSFRKTDRLIHLENGQEKVLTKIGFHLEKYLSVTGNKAVWTEYEQDPRRSKRNYSNIVFYDLKTKEKTRLTSVGRYFSPAFSYSEGRILAVTITPEQKNGLVILDARDGNTLQILPNPNNRFIAFPKWAENDTDIVYIGKENSQLAIFKFNLIDKKLTQLSDWTHHTMADLFVKNGYVYFTSSFSGIDNIYRLSLNGDRAIEQLTSLRIGGYYPALSTDGQQLLFSEFTDMGYELSSLDLSSNNARKQAINIIEPTEQSFYKVNFFAKEEGGSILDDLPSESYEINRYKGLFKGMKLHSWNFTPSVALPTLDVQIDNYLSDFSVNMIGGYNLNESSPVFIASATYGKLYPQLTVFTSLTNRNSEFLVTPDSLQRQQFDQLSVGGRIAVPLTWLKDNYSTSLNTFGSFTQRYLSAVEFGGEKQADRNLGTIQLGVSVNHLHRTALQNLAPRWGQSFSILYQQTADNRADRQIRLGGSALFPGIGYNHSLKLGFGFQREQLRNVYQFADAFEYPRGFRRILNDEFLKLSVDYQLPLAYPDWGFWGITYFKRISINAFFDYGRRKIESVDLTDNHNSVGAELVFDNHFWNELPVTFGLRNSYLLTEDAEKYQFEFFVKSFLVE
ncbi:MAG: hypothetical protein AAGJ18_18315 [Bacteroidota bacterium]